MSDERRTVPAGERTTIAEAEELVAAGGARWTDDRGGRFAEAARRYSALRWALTPADGKRPRRRSWEQAQPTEPEHAAGQWSHYGKSGANMAVVAGPSKLAIVDVDGAEGEATLARLLGEEVLPPAPTVSTGRGRHVYFAGDDSLRPYAGEGLDLRAGPSVAILPPSTHPDTGREYAWTIDPWTTPPPPLPPSLREHFARERRRAASAPVADVIPQGKRRSALLSVAGKLKRAGLTGDEILPTLLELNRRCQPPLDEAELRSIAFPSTIRVVAADAIPTVPATTGPTTSTTDAAPLAEVVAAFRRWLHLPDAGALYVTLASVVANRLPGDPVWLLLVAASSSGKTEILFSLGELPEVEPAATVTEAALLSGVPRKEHAAGATGGLLRTIGEYGILTLKDFGSVLSMQRDARAGVLAALRECYDGTWDRPVGADGGKTLHWEGKLGLIAGVTTVVDRHHGVMDALGSRFAFYRVEVDERKQQSRRSLEHVRTARGMRSELRAAVAGFFAGLTLPAGHEHGLSDDDVERIVCLADFVTLARSPVERDAYSTREIELVPDAEAPARFAGMLASLLDGLRLIGLDDAAAWQLVTKVALDSMPAQRRKVIEHLIAQPTTTTTAAATMLGLPTTTARRTLEDLAAHGVVTRESGGEGKPDTWALSRAARDDYTAGTFPEMSGSPSSFNQHHVQTDISGKVR